MDDLCIALVRAVDICSPYTWPTGLAVYYDPGSVSLASNQTLSYCYLERFEDGTLMMWSKDYCRLDRDLAEQAWRQLDHERRRVEMNPRQWLLVSDAYTAGGQESASGKSSPGVNLPEDSPDGIHPTMFHWAGILYRLSYFEPGHRFVASMLEKVKAGYALSDKQIDIVKQILSERGGMIGLRRRHYTQWRLMRLSELYLDDGDRDTVTRFSALAGMPQGLRASLLPVISVLEEKHWRARQEQTAWRAEQIAEALAMCEDSE